MLIEKLMTDEDCYRLFQYGIEGRQYEIGNINVISTTKEWFMINACARALLITRENKTYTGLLKFQLYR